MTFLTNTGNKGDGIPITIRHRLRIAREETYPDLPIAAFSKEVLGVGKNMAAAYESKNGTRIENMKDMVLNKWADVCGVTVAWLKGEDSDGGDGGAAVNTRSSGYKFGGSSSPRGTVTPMLRRVQPGYDTAAA